MNENTVSVKSITFHRHVLIEITKKCNLFCKHCFTSAGKPLKHELTAQEWAHIAEDLIVHKFDAFTISGGEPLLEYSKVVIIAKTIRNLNRNAKTYLFSNGLLLKSEHIPFLKKYFNGVGTSVDGVEQSHDWIRNCPGSFKRAISAISLLVENDIPVFIQSMVTPQTQEYFEDVVNLALQKGVKAIRFSHVDFFGRAKLRQQLLGSHPKVLELLYSRVNKLNREYDMYITTNLITKDDLANNPDKFKVLSLHILPNGDVLPWYGLPETYSLWKYPPETLSAISKTKLRHRAEKLYRLVDTARISALNRNQKVIDFDNVISACLH